MINNLAKRLTSVFVSSGEVRQEDEDIYAYACEILLSTLMNIIVCLIISVVLSQLIEGFLFMICFAWLRHYTGGHHAKHHWECITTFSIIHLYYKTRI